MSAPSPSRLEPHPIQGGAALHPVPRRLRVLQLVEWLAMGGAEHGVRKLVRGLGEDFDNEIFAVRGCEESFARMHFSDIAIHALDVPPSKLQVFRLAWMMRKLRPDIVHSRNWGCIEAVIAARIARVPVVVHSEHGYNPDMLTGLTLRRRALQRLAFGMADAVVAVSDELRRFHARQAWLKPQRLRVLHNGVDTDQFRTSARSRELWRQRLGIAPQTFVIGTVGRLVAIKDQQSILRAADILVSHGVDAHVLLIGTGPELSGLQQLAAASPRLHGRVTFTGASENVPELLNATDVFVLASLSEGLSNTLLEAMASGRCVVATNVGGNPEVVQPARSGLLFPPGDVSSLSAALEELAHVPGHRESMGAAARQRVLQCFSVDAMVRGYRRLYRELAARRGLLPDHGKDGHVRH